MAYGTLSHVVDPSQRPSSEARIQAHHACVFHINLFRPVRLGFRAF